MNKVSLNVVGDEYYRLRRWIKAQDPFCTVSVKPTKNGLWRVSVSLTKRYLIAVIARRWETP
jgi:hypothetical protein